jgi:outer membrane protein OmpA-like peptidoglycan-associated protein
VQSAPAYSSSNFQPSTAQPLPADLAAALPAGVAQRYQETLRKPVPGIPSALPIAPVMAGRGVGAFASIPFASGSSQLSSTDRQTVAQVVSAARNGFGAVRVVGHASSSAASQSESQRMFANWEVSQARATAVADELVRQGVDAARIIIEAVGDSQAGAVSGYGDAEAASRRVDLFLE